MKHLLIFSALMTMAFFASGQQPASAPNDTKKVAQEKMLPLAWLTGDWEGEAWTYVGRDKITFRQREIVTADLNNTIIKLIGIGIHENDTVHKAFAIIFFDHAARSYKLNSFIADGKNTIGDATFENGKFIWTLKAEGRTIRFTIRKNEKGQWEEDGEMLMGEGKPPFHFFHMALDKKR